MPALTQAQLNHVTTSTYIRVDKTKRLTPLDRKRRPFHEWLRAIMKPTSFEGGAVTYNTKIQSSLTGVTWQGDDEIEASEPDFVLPLTFGYYNFNVAVQILHDELKRLGFTVVPNSSRNGSASFAMSMDDTYKLLDYIEELVEEARDAFIRRNDLLMHRTGAASPTDPQGLFSLINSTPTIGSLGGRVRSLYAQLQNYVKTGSTTTAAGTLRADLDTAMRQANIYSSTNGVPGEVDIIFAGQAWINGYTSYCEVNGLRYTRDTSELKIYDISIPDVTLQFKGVPIVHNPTFEAVDALDTFSPTLTKSAVGLNSKTWRFRNQFKLDMVMSSPMDPPKQRITRMDLDGTYQEACVAPASNFYSAVA